MLLDSSVTIITDDQETAWGGDGKGGHRLQLVLPDLRLCPLVPPEDNWRIDRGGCRFANQAASFYLQERAPSLSPLRTARWKPLDLCGEVACSVSTANGITMG